MITTTEAVETVLGNGITTLFKKRGFQKKGGRFLKWEGEVCRSAHFYASHYSLPGNVMFTIEAGIFVKYMQEVLSGQPFPKSLIDATPVFGRRFGRSMELPLPTMLAEFWTVYNAEDIVTITEQVRTRCSNDVLPFLDHLGSEKRMLKELQDTTADINFIPACGRAAIIQAQLGLVGEAQRSLSAVAARIAQNSASMREIDRQVIDEFLFRVKDFVDRSVERCTSPNIAASAVMRQTS